MNNTAQRAIVGIDCELCHSPNSSEKQFCGECGSRLLQPCHACKSQNAVNVKFCGNCGENLPKQFATAKANLKKALQVAKESCQEGNFFQSASVLKAITDHGDTRLEKYMLAAAELQKKVDARREQKASELDDLFAKAERHLAAGDFAAAAEWMKQIPVSMRTDKMRKTAETIEVRISEIRSLSRKVRDGLGAKAFDSLLPIVERLCELKGKDEQLASLREKLRKRFATSQAHGAKSRLQFVVKLLGSDKLRQASTELQQVPDDVELDERLQQTVDQAREICWLYSELQQLTHATPQAMALLRRFQRLRPQSRIGERFASKLSDRLAAKTKDSRERFVPVRILRSHGTDLPVTWWNGFRNCNVDPTAAIALQAHSGRFAVAYGLALQGVQLATIRTNLSFDVGQTMLQKLSGHRRGFSGEDAWGIDIGATALKAIRLTREKDSDEVQLTSAVVIPHSIALNLTSDEEQRSEIVEESLQRLQDETGDRRAQAIISIPATKTLGRFFTIPALKPKKLTDAIQYEAKHQIPLPEDHVVFDYHVWPVESGMHDVALIAAQRDQVRPIICAFERSAYRIAAVQSASVALYNACYREFLWESGRLDAGVSDQNEDSSGKTIAVLDVGAESSVCTLVSEKGLRFRNFAFGTFRLSQMLSNQFGCDHKRADVMRCRIESNAWLHKVHAVLDKGFADLNGEMNRTLDSLAQEMGQPSQLVITGGGGNQHGVIRSIVTGSEKWIGSSSDIWESS